MIKKILKALNKDNDKTEHLKLLHELQKIPFVEKPDEMPHYENFKKVPFSQFQQKEDL